jgi:hypothetical protein
VRTKKGKGSSFFLSRLGASESEVSRAGNKPNQSINNHRPLCDHTFNSITQSNRVQFAAKFQPAQSIFLGGRDSWTVGLMVVN